jgi:hypothetical protein
MLQAQLPYWQAPSLGRDTPGCCSSASDEPKRAPDMVPLALYIFHSMVLPAPVLVDGMALLDNMG